MNQSLVMCKVYLSVMATLLLCSCSQVKTNPVKVNQTPSDSDAFVIQVSKAGCRISLCKKFDGLFTGYRLFRLVYDNKKIISLW